jgi:hypothetical protein
MQPVGKSALHGASSLGPMSGSSICANVDDLLIGGILVAMRGNPSAAGDQQLGNAAGNPSAPSASRS